VPGAPTKATSPLIVTALPKAAPADEVLLVSF